MKKIIVTEGQIKSIVNNLLTEEEDKGFMKAVQQFLNAALKLNPPLAIDGLTGPGSQTEKAIMKYQEKINAYPIDGVWGDDTMSKMPKKHKEYFEKLKLKNMNGLDRMLYKIVN